MAIRRHAKLDKRKLTLLKELEDLNRITGNTFVFLISFIFSCLFVTKLKSLVTLFVCCLSVKKYCK